MLASLPIPTSCTPDMSASVGRAQQVHACLDRALASRIARFSALLMCCDGDQDWPRNLEWSLALMAGLGTCRLSGCFKQRGAPALESDLDALAAISEPEPLSLSMLPLALCAHDVDAEPVSGEVDEVASREMRVRDNQLAPTHWRDSLIELRPNSELAGGLWHLATSRPVQSGAGFDLPISPDGELPLAVCQLSAPDRHLGECRDRHSQGCSPI